MVLMFFFTRTCVAFNVSSWEISSPGQHVRVRVCLYNIVMSYQRRDAHPQGPKKKKKTVKLLNVRQFFFHPSLAYVAFLSNFRNQRRCRRSCMRFIIVDICSKTVFN